MTEVVNSGKLLRDENRKPWLLFSVRLEQLEKQTWTDPADLN